MKRQKFRAGKPKLSPSLRACPPHGRCSAAAQPIAPQSIFTVWLDTSRAAQVPGAEVTVWRVRDPVKGDDHAEFDEGVLDAPVVTVQVRGQVLK